MQTTKALYKIWRNQKGRSIKRLLTEDQVNYYKSKYPNWRFRKIKECEPEHTTTCTCQNYKPQAQSNHSYVNHELANNRLRLQHKKEYPVITYDDILDVMLEIKTVAE